MGLRKSILFYCIIFLLILFIDGLFILTKSGIADRNTPSDSQSHAGNKGSRNESSIFAGEPVNMLILGLDEEKVRSDVILLLNFMPAESSLNILSIPRDTRVRARGKTEKINALIGMGGEKLIAGKVAEITGLTINYYLTINFKGFRKLIDILGGVQLEVPFDMYYDDPTQNLHIHLTKGKQILNGEKAEQFVRYRKGNWRGEGYEDGDLGRIKAQQNLIRELIIQKLKLRYFLKIDDIYYILKQYVRTNADITDINYYSDSIKKIRFNKIRTFSLPGDTAYIGGLWYFIHNTDKTRELIESSFN